LPTNVVGGILHGEVDSDIAGLRRRTTHKGLTGAKKKNLRAIFAYLEKNKHRMCYDKYVRLACPVTTGVIEGACHHVIKDRMGRAGIRWKIPGAQAMLNLRTIQINGDWTAFQDFRIALENDWLYPNTKALKPEIGPLPTRVAYPPWRGMPVTPKRPLRSCHRTIA
jgi:hypothetical protein